MMSGAALFETMSQQIAARCEGNLSAARGEAGSIQADAREQSDAVRVASVKTTQDEMAVLDVRWRQKAHAEASKAGLVVKNEGVQQVLEHVRERIRQIASGADFGAIVDALLAEVMEAAEGDVVVLGPPGHVDRMRTWLSNNGKGPLRVEGSDEFWDGVAIQDPARTYRISNTLSGRFARVAEEARKICMTSLFDEGPA